MAKLEEREPDPLCPIPEWITREELECFYYIMGGNHEES